MTNTTTPVESLGTPSAAAPFYRWEVPDKPVAIHLSLDLVDRLEREAIESFKAVTKRGSEIGGVLVGRVVPGVRRAVFLEEFEPVECEYSRGPLYMLAEADTERLKQVLERVKAGPRSAVGFFRSNTRSNLVLDEEDLALAEEFFSDPSQVFLLVRPFSMKASLGGFFFWENGQIHEASYLPFPFKRAELLKSFAELIVAAPEKAVEAPPPPPPAAKEPLVMPKREERPPVSAPIAFKREEAKPSVVPPRREEPPPVLKREEPKPAPPPPPPVVKREEPKPAPPPPPVARREEPKPAPPPPVVKREEPKPAPPPVAKREEPRPAPPPPPVFKREEPRPTLVPPRREERTMSPLGLKREERPAGPAIVPKEPPAPAVKKEERPAPPPVTARREERPAPVPKEEKPPVVLKKEEKPEVVPAAKREEPPVVARREEPPVVKEERPAVKAAEPIKPPEVLPKPEMRPAAPLPAAGPGVFARLKWLIAAAVLLVVVAAGAYFMFASRARQPQPAENAAATALGLKVERNAGQLVLSWNPRASIIQSATQAILTIADGDGKEDVALELSQLRNGGIVYSPITNDVSFRLEVTDLKNRKSVSESTRFLAGRPSPAVAAPVTAAAKPAPETPEPAKPQPATATPAPAAPAPQQQAAAPAPEQPRVVAGPAVTVQPPKPDSLGGRLRAAEPQELPAPPALDATAGALTARSLPVTSATPAAPPPVAPQSQPPAQPAAAKPAPQAQPPASQPPAPAVRTGGQAQEAKLVRRFAPVYPALARQTRVSGIVRVLAVIGKDGRVKRASAVSGPPLLRPSATEAVMRWVYSPATLNGQTVEAETQVDVNFML